MCRRPGCPSVRYRKLSTSNTLIRPPLEGRHALPGARPGLQDPGSSVPLLSCYATGRVFRRGRGRWPEPQRARVPGPTSSAPTGRPRRSGGICRWVGWVMPLQASPASMRAARSDDRTEIDPHRMTPEGPRSRAYPGASCFLGGWGAILLMRDVNPCWPWSVSLPS